ncbi:hypothetical protein ACF0C0_12460 [Pseudomonas aeruginosa]|uniref:Uncharacterized protein n=1 Tax=Pseudomonas aeruginosa TaxID=287 RepID=A0A6B1YP97_PSEAI|nr:hypothetical protein [Pseudomonas aeruginosa]MDY1103309.1 hypothetical protein [Pseudomonas aeruginosa]MZZ16632.1 hypothetical protein [Pseudomonas aeruginosa]HBN9243721.1 hypothetical protein [Pseudomonas aeruginosa]
MKQQDEYTEEDRIYGAWLGLRNRINKIDYGQATEDFPGQRSDLYRQMEALESKYRGLTGESIKRG